MRSRSASYIVAGAILFIIIVGLLGKYSTTTGVDMPAVGYLPVISYDATRFSYFPIIRSDPTLTSTPTPTPQPMSTPRPTPTPTRVTGGSNLLPNPSFENGWYHPSGIPELQIPNQWIFEWDEGDNLLAPEPWNNWVRPEVRVLPRDFLPPHERDLFIWDGIHTVKVFKGYGALSYRMKTTVNLPPGRYQLEVSVFPDLVVGYTSDGQKIWAPDPKSGEVRITIDGRHGSWILPIIGQKNTIRRTFNVDQSKDVSITVAIRGRWAILNNGWFMDDWRLATVAR
jgi:hypothetical protein